ncbi:ABC transporter permease [Hydrogenibacillus schlegelii]|uniref:ABC transporter permease n=1 Tax=Hydrogenibacillus schlegelii TaxID=1484 RepID=A0A132NAV8_HYDSH|nr:MULTISPECIES: ABC transporter permease [Hydrogenibacillus]KWX07295.1 peptide ABC transporter permease [Hydrogenibacillus schlegelii]MBT9282595.1 ABC transporter permease [Hydrogenibacillus schlegelii]OAR04902.1 peptide ABC transporter permease [Hydrogenibacillus schlegelii]PTQ52983.1 MAG: Oligopeptide transport system permease protein OppB [Hydrogenibacillus schlegelii]QZA32547.1 ABC transporter permease [Hydrogenibacillus sp. N12]
MLRYVLEKFFLMLFTLFVIATLTFFMARALPGGPYQNPEKLTPQVKALFDMKYGLSDPLPIQYLRYLNNLLHGDLGHSFKYLNQSVNGIIAQTFPVSARLGLQALLFALPLGLAFGIVAALFRGRLPDYVLVFIAVLGVSIPNFVLAGFMQYWLGVQWKVLPVARWGTFQHTIMPSLALGIGILALITRLMRTSMLDVLGSDYLRTARAKGLSPTAVVVRHGIRNALLPIITIVGVLMVDLITGSIIIEQIFVIPGMGKHYVNSINTNDYMLIMGLTIFYSALLVLAIFITDVLYGVVDPRIRVAGRKE